MSDNKKRGLKFDAKYGVKEFQVYKTTASTESIQIPPSGHALHDPTSPTKFDPIRVDAIDRDGHMNDAIEVWTDPDNGVLWVIDGRSRWLDVQEVNRRRLKDGRDMVQPLLVPFRGDEKAAVARVREKNYHRRVPTVSDMGVDLNILRKQGYSWDDCAKALHMEVEDAEQWGRRILPLAFCIPEVRAAVDAGQIGKGAAKKFGGGAHDGSKALGKKEQLALLGEMLAEKEKPSAKNKPVSTTLRVRAMEALTNGASEQLSKADKNIAEVVAATIARIGGDKKALKAWPEVAAIFEEALKPKPAGRPKKAKDEAEAE